VSEPAHLRATVPSLAEVAAGAAQLEGQPAAVLSELRRQARHLLADLDAALDRIAAGRAQGGPGRFYDRLTLTTAQAAEWLGLDESHVQDLCRRGAISASKPGKAWLIRPDAIREWVANEEGIRHGGAPEPPPSSRRPAVRIDALPRNRRG
jgi:excisionase family DNA binding protein